jgi:small subunit ribosomal protein S16
MYKLVVQDSKTRPTSGRVVSYVGTYNPHTKELNVNKADVEKFLSNGAQPSPRVVRILTKEGLAMPKWVKTLVDKKSATRNAEKWRKFAPKEEAAAEVIAEETPVEA